MSMIEQEGNLEEGTQDQLTPQPAYNRVDLTEFSSLIYQVKQEFSKILIGNQSLVELLLTSLLCEGHVLVESVPGLAKTLSAKVMARTLDAGFNRIQFTPDLMPSDILGTSIFNQKDLEFKFQKGPIFSNIILIDEINSCLLYTSPSPRDQRGSRMPSSA